MNAYCSSDIKLQCSKSYRSIKLGAKLCSLTCQGGAKNQKTLEVIVFAIVSYITL